MKRTPENSVLAKTRRGTKERGQKLQSHRPDISDVEVLRILRSSSSGKEKEPESWKKLHVGGIESHKLPALSSYDDKFSAEAVRVAGGQKSHFEAWQCGAPHNVFGKHGHQDGVR